jgi:hypothetical protein
MEIGMDVIISILIDRGRFVVNDIMIWTKIVIFGKISHPCHNISFPTGDYLRLIITISYWI